MHALILWGAQTTASLNYAAADEHMAFGADGCFAYLQGSMSHGDFRAAFDTDLKTDNAMLPDNQMWVKLAVWLNDTGVSVHQEITMTVTFQYVSANP